MSFTVIGTLEDPSSPGTPRVGKLVFKPRPGKFVAEGSINFGDVTGTLDATGAVKAADGVSVLTLKWLPGLTYHVRLIGSSDFGEFDFEVPAVDGGTVDLLTVVPVQVPVGLDPNLYAGVPVTDALMAARVRDTASSTRAALSDSYARRAATVIAPPRAARVVTLLQAGSGFTATGAAASNPAVVSDFIRGGSSFEITTAGTGAQTNIDNLNLLPAIDITGGRAVRVHFKVVSGRAYVSKINLIVGSGATSFGDGFYRYELLTTPPAALDTAVVREGEWSSLTVASPKSVTGAPDLAALTDVRFQVIDNNAGSPVVVRFNGLEIVDAPIAFPNGCVSIAFDDGRSSVWDLARPVLDAAGFTATNYIISDLVGTSGRITEAQIRALHRAGWETAGHGMAADHANRWTTLSPDAMSATASTVESWIVDNGPSPMPGVAYPGGSHSDVVVSEIRKGLSYGRTIDAHNMETIPPFDPFRIRAASSISGHAGGVSVAATNDLISEAKQRKAWLVLVFHNVTDGATAATTDITTSDFRAIVDHIVAQGIPVRTVADVLAATQ